jgi:hypothetical protein
MTTSDRDPWAGIGRPADATHLAMRRASEKARWDFFWAKDHDGHCALVLRAAVGAIPQTRLPRLKGLDLTMQHGAAGEKSSLVIRLLDAAQRDIFLRLCEDILSSAEEAASEPEAAARAVTRTWRWHHLLRGGRGLLTAEEQIGLIGELTLLESVFVPRCGPARAVEAWRGPLDEVQDFTLGPLRVEAKARGPRNAEHVSISSEHQLQEPEGGSLFLAVGVFEPADAGADGESVTDVARRVRQFIASLDSGALPRYDALLAAAGLELGDDYSSWQWRQKERSVFVVREGFPRITPDALPAGVTGVRYGLSLPGCGAFLVPPTALTDAIDEAANG